jgi:hypothetical protein
MVENHLLLICINIDRFYPLSVKDFAVEKYLCATKIVLRLVGVLYLMVCVVAYFWDRSF